MPEVKDAQPVGITILHLGLVDELDLDGLRTVLQSYDNRYVAIRDAVLETEPSFDESRLTQLDLADLLVEPPVLIADRFRS